MRFPSKARILSKVAPFQMGSLSGFQYEVLRISERMDGSPFELKIF